MMFLRLIFESFRRQQRRKLMAGIAITLGVSVATAMIAVATNIGDKINSELRSYGANLVIYPDSDSLDVEIGGVNLRPASDGAFLNESDLPQIKEIFWAHNIVAFAPMLPVRVDVAAEKSKLTNVELLGTYFDKSIGSGNDAATGVKTTNPWWKVQGAWPKDDSSDVLVGDKLASNLNAHQGSDLNVAGRDLHVSGILNSGGAEDEQIVAPLAVAQQIIGRPGAVRRVMVSALTKPEDELARRNPETLKSNPELWDRWYCSPYVNSIAYQLQQAIPHSRAEQIRQVAQNEGTVLDRIKGLMLLVTLAALLASALAVSAAMATTIFERRREVGLMKALGAGNILVATLFFVEAALLALMSGVIGYFAGGLLARQVGWWIFDSQITIQPVLFPMVLAIAVLVTFAGSAASIRKAMHFDPVFALRGDA
jgi:putative ABC transport system permease protein